VCESLPVSAVFDVDDDGKIAFMHANRYRDVGRGRAILSGWTGHCSDCREFNGFRVPTCVEVAWELENGSFTYARFQLTALEYNTSERFLIEWSQSEAPLSSKSYLRYYSPNSRLLLSLGLPRSQ
jgi:hypothetical protein